MTNESTVMNTLPKIVTIQSGMLARNPTSATAVFISSGNTKIEITHAVRDTSIEDKEIKEGQILGIVDGKIRAVGDEMTNLVEDTLKSMDIDDYELVTVYYGADVSAEEAEKLLDDLSEKYPEIEFELHEGGQAVYYYLLSAE